jgi:hemerythrin
VANKIIYWQNYFSVEVKELGSQYQNLIDMVNELYGASYSSLHKEKINKTLAKKVTKNNIQPDNEILRNT